MCVVYLVNEDEGRSLCGKMSVLDHLFVFLFGIVTLAKKNLWPKKGNFQECSDV